MIKGAPESHYYVLLLKSCLLGSVGEEFGNLLLLLMKHIETCKVHAQSSSTVSHILLTSQDVTTHSNILRKQIAVYPTA